MEGITLIGLGPGNPSHITLEAWDALTSAHEIYLRTKHHPTIYSLPEGIIIHSFDYLYEAGEKFEDVYTQIVERVIRLGRREEGVLYAVPGDPFVAEATCPEIVRQAQALGIPVKVVNGVSFLEPIFSALTIDPFPRMQLQDAIELTQQFISTIPTDFPILIAQIYSKIVAAELKMTLSTVYPDKHLVTLIHAAGTKSQIVETLPLYKIDRSKSIGLTSSLYVPPLEDGISFEAFQDVVAHLRAPNGCPWDREQTHESLRPCLLEETYETLSAIDSGDMDKLKEELGDLILQVVLNVQIASEDGNFNMVDVLRMIKNKIVSRHPHVFADVHLDDVKGVLSNWEKLKAEERKQEGKGIGILDGVPGILPALAQAQEYQERAARVGFDWSSIDGVLDKIDEEIREIRSVKNEKDYSSEFGDLFFSLVNLARWKKIDAESILRKANVRFKKRFIWMEKKAQSESRTLNQMSQDELNTLWEEGKRKS